MPGFVDMHDQELIPLRYNPKSEFTATVKAEVPNAFDFDLEKGNKQTPQKDLHQSPRPGYGHQTLPYAALPAAPILDKPHPLPVGPRAGLNRFHHESFTHIGRQFDDTSSSRVHADRAAGRHRDHRGPDRPAPARGAGGPRGRPPRPVRQQPQADRAGDAQLPRRQRPSCPPGHRTAVIGTFQTFILPYMEQEPVLQRYDHAGQLLVRQVTSSRRRQRPGQLRPIWQPPPT